MTRLRLRPTLRSAAELALWLLLGAAMLLFLAVGVLPRTGWYRVETVLSGSMRPDFAPGDLIVVRPEPLRDVRVGQVISYHIPIGDQHVQTHRVVKVVRGGEHPVVVTKGDANDSVDPWQARLDGTTAWRVQAVAPNLGWLIVWLRSPLIRILTVLGAPLLLALLGLWRIWRDPEEEIRDVAPAA
ncbi:MAG TPA: signal peptidase I [Gaiellaceae bacterium]|nr:signal peptidase I [Gaiellaceae bacterium]